MGEKMVFNLEEFKAAVEKSNLTVAEIAEQIPCSAVDVYRYLRGDSRPRKIRLKRFVEILGPTVAGLKHEGLKVTGDKKFKSNFSEMEHQCIHAFKSLSVFSQARVLSAETVLFEFGNDADLEFAADLGGELVLQAPQKEQTG